MIGRANFALFCSSNSCETAHIADGLAVSVFQYVGVLYISGSRRYRATEDRQDGAVGNNDIGTVPVDSLAAGFHGLATCQWCSLCSVS